MSLLARQSFLRGAGTINLPAHQIDVLQAFYLHTKWEATMKAPLRVGNPGFPAAHTCLAQGPTLNRVARPHRSLAHRRTAASYRTRKGFRDSGSLLVVFE